MKPLLLIAALLALSLHPATADQPSPPANQLGDLVLDPDGPVYVNCLTNPGYTYHLEVTTSLNPPADWTTVPGTTTTATASELWFSDTNPDHTTQRYYRSVIQ